MDDSGRDWGGPYLQAAFLCERILQEADGVVSAIRIVDRIDAQVADDLPEVPPPSVPVNLTLFMSFRSGQAREIDDLSIVMEEPSGLKRESMTHSVLFEGGEDRGSNIIVPLAMMADQEGIYWFNVLLRQRLITRVPIRVVFQRPIRGPGSTQS